VSTSELKRLDVATQLRDFGRVLREQAWLIALCVVLAGCAAAAYAETRPRNYEATARLLLQQDNPAAQVAGTGSPFVDPVRQAVTDQQLATSGAVASRVADRLHLRDFSAFDDVSASLPADSNVLTITVGNRSPRLAAKVANAFAVEYIAFRQATERQRIGATLKVLAARLRSAPRSEQGVLRAQIARARLLKSVTPADASFIQHASVPTVRVGPKVSRKLVPGLLFGVLVGLGLAMLRDRLDPRVKRLGDVKAVFPGTPVLASIPRPQAGKRGARVTVEGFRTLQSKLDVVCPNGRPRSMLVTSAGSGDGKSTTVLNLGLAMDEQRHRPLVVEADLRRSSLSKGLGLDKGPGLTGMLKGTDGIDEAVTYASVSPGSKHRGLAVALTGKLAVLPAGRAPDQPRGLLNDKALGTVLVSAQAIGDTILVDGPPLGLFSDMLPLARRVDGVIVAVRLYHTRKDDLEGFAEQLLDAGVKPIGLVVLGSHADPSAYDGY
jgi:polysaccharide biosynthesis transport protein